MLPLRYHEARFLNRMLLHNTLRNTLHRCEAMITLSFRLCGNKLSMSWAHKQLQDRIHLLLILAHISVTLTNMHGIAQEVAFLLDTPCVKREEGHLENPRPRTYLNRVFPFVAEVTTHE